MVFFLPVQPDPQPPHEFLQVDVQFTLQPHEPEELLSQPSSQPLEQVIEQPP